ncbi:MAG: hypothetical protein IT338_04115 [Thermomicrobiales bacterium]|nr:hypothetical protein [Thermomicrobiales bacterium]
MTDDKDRAGLGKVIYTTDEESGARPTEEERDERADVAEADKESFPASDPPGFSGQATPEES